MSDLSSSPDRHQFQKERYLERRAKENRTTDNDGEVRAMAEYYDEERLRVKGREADPEWAKNNMEYDLRTSVALCEKVRTNHVYAQNLYAAMCNREFQRIPDDDSPETLVQILREDLPVWSCSWRYAGGIVADMSGQGDYIDWYCSGIHHDDANVLYVSEGCVTHEIEQDLKSIGWLVLP